MSRERLVIHEGRLFRAIKLPRGYPEGLATSDARPVGKHRLPTEPLFPQGSTRDKRIILEQTGPNSASSSRTTRRRES